MGVIICEKHGQQFINLVPSTLRHAVLDGKPLPRHQFHKVKHVYSDGEEVTWFWCDTESMDRCSIPFDRVLTEDEYWRIFERLTLDPVCRCCLDEWLSESD